MGKKNGNGGINGYEYPETFADAKYVNIVDNTKVSNHSNQRRTKIKCRTENQKEFLKVIDNNDIIL